MQAAQPAEYLPPSSPAVAVLPSYEPSEGDRDSTGLLHFPDHPEFTPSLTPQQVHPKDMSSWTLEAVRVLVVLEDL